MPSEKSTSFSSLNVNAGVVITALAPVLLAIWTVSGWANDIEDNVERNQEQIEELTTEIKDYREEEKAQRAVDLEREQAQHERQDGILDLLEALAEQDPE